MIKILAILDDSVKDNATGHYSHSRIIALLIAFGATVFMWKLILLGGMGIEYFLGYLAYGTGQMTMNKFLDNKDTARNDQAKYKNRIADNETDAPIRTSTSPVRRVKEDIDNEDDMFGRNRSRHDID